MKKAILSVSLILCAILGSFAQTTSVPSPNPNAPKFSFETEVLDYGTIEHAADGDRVFTFVNTGKEPLIISNAKGSCGCTTPQWPKEPIMPGETATIKVHYDTKRVGAFTKTVTLTSNADTPTKVLKIKGTVKAKPAEPAAE
jgi:hypothetical protein